MKRLDEFHEFPKGPFKGKGGLRQPTLRQARAWLAQEREALRRLDYALDALSAEVRAHFPEGPAYIAHQRGRGYIWRLRASHPNWQHAFTFADNRGKKLLRSLPLHARAAMRRFDATRARLNLEARVIAYQCRAVKAWIAYCEAVGEAA